MTPKKTEQLCPIHSTSMVTLKGKLYCKSCLYASHLTHQAQKEAIAHWRKSEIGIASEKQYEQSDKGKAARGKYLHSEKYKLARKAYNERLKESLAIARSARTESAKGLTKEERQVATGLEGLLAEVREYLDTNLKAPTVKNVVDTAKRDYNQVISEEKAKELIDVAKKGRRS